LLVSIVASVAMPKRRWSKRRVVISGFVVIRRFFRFEGAGGAKWSTSASACVIPTMRTSMAARGKAVSSAVSSGRHEITKRTFRTPLEPLDSILVVFQNYMSYKRNNQQIQWLMRVGAGCALLDSGVVAFEDHVY
jgi:hypothetical protein